jgi:hypothetical protein
VAKNIPDRIARYRSGSLDILVFYSSLLTILGVLKYPNGEWGGRCRQNLESVSLEVEKMGDCGL